MNSVRKFFFILIHVLTAVLLGIALFFSIRIGFGYGLSDVGIPESGQMKLQIAQNFEFTWGADGLLLAMIILLAVFILIPGSWLDRASHKGRVRFFLVLTVFLIAMQLFLVFGLNIIQNTDSFEVQDQALAIVRGMRDSVDYTKSAYFRKYGNNDLYLALCVTLYRICRFFHISQWRKFFVLFNMLCVDLGIFMTCRIIWLIKGPATGLKAYFLCVLNPLNYLLLHWTYTCTFSVPLMMVSVYAAVLVQRKRGGVLSKLIAAAVIGVTAALGYSMRPTAVFPIIALVLCAVIFGIPETNAGVSGKKPKTRGKRAAAAAASVLLAVLCLAGTSLAVRNVSKQYDPDQRYKFPLEHWIMIGITGDGRVSGDDIHYTQSFPTVEEKKAADREVIKEAFRERGVSGTALFYLEKIGLTWSDGTGEYYQRTTQSENSSQILYQMTSGEDSGATILYCVAYRMVLLLMAILGILRNLYQRQSRFFTVSAVTVLGGLVFYMFWEGKPVYSYPFLFYLVLLGCNAWNPLTRRYAVYSRRRGVWVGRVQAVTAWIILVTAGISVVFRGYAVSTRPYYTEPTLVSDSISLVEWQTLYGPQSMLQEFYPRYAFNHIRIRMRKNPAGTGSLLVQLRSGQKVIAQKTVTKENLRQGQVTLAFATVQPEKNQKFELLFQNLSDRQAPARVGTRLCYVTSEYRGRRMVDGKERPGDVLVRVYEQRELE